MKSHRTCFGLCTALAMFAACGPAFSAAAATAETVNELYPGLTTGALACATLGDLPEGVLLKSGKVEVTSAALDRELAGALTGRKEQLEKNKLFLLENLVTRDLLLEAARAAQGPEQAGNLSENELLPRYFDRVVAGVQATDEEVAQFYEENREMCGGASLDQIKEQLKDYVVRQKQLDAVTEHVRTMGQRTPIVLAAEWVEEQVKLALDNPVDKARSSGKPSLVDFGASGCVPCDMMAPILEALKAKYEGTLNVVFVHVREDEILTSRYGVQSIPVQVFFDKDGREVYRHTGYYPQAEIERRIEAMGAE